MDKLNRIENCVDRKHNMHNCAQAIVCEYADICGIDEETLYEMSQGFGAGMGTMEGTCGAISGAALVLGLVNKDRAKSREQVKKLTQEFEDRNKSIICKDLKGIETGKVLRSCEDCVRDAAEFLEELLVED